MRTGLHGASIRGRIRADAGPLLLSALVVLLVSLLAGAVPGLMEKTADEAVRDAVQRAGNSAKITVSARWEPDDTLNGRARLPRLADDVNDLRLRALDELGSELQAMMRPPVAAVISPTLKVTDGSVLRTFRMAYLAAGDGPQVTWTAGTAPAAPADDTAEVGWYAPPWRVQVGVSETAADLFGVRAGALLKVADERGNTKNVQVSGIFRPVDPADPVWAEAPWLLNPAADADGAGTTRFGGLLTAGSLPDARLAFGPDELERTVVFSPDTTVLTWSAARTVNATVVSLQARSASSNAVDTTTTWRTGLDSVLDEVTAQVETAEVHASVLLAAILAGAVLVLLLAADLLVRRRSPALILARQRGAALTALGAELLAESALVALAAAGAGCAAALLVTGGVAWLWVAPVLVTAVAAVPAYGILHAASATRDRKTPANRSARRWARHTGALRRAAAEIAVLVAAAAAIVALHQRGLGSGLPVLAPTLAVIAGAVLLVRLLPPVTHLALRWSLRSRRPLAVFGTAQASATSGRALPVAALVTSTALASFALVTAATVDHGLAGGAQETVGADVRADLTDDAAATTDETARRIAAAPGVTGVVTGHVTDSAQIVADGRLVPARLVIVDSRALTGTALTGAQALVRSAGDALHEGSIVDILQPGKPAVRLTASGAAPAVGGATEVVIVDVTAGLPAPPNTIWVTGPGATQATDGLTVVSRTEVARSRRAAPLVAGLLRLTWAAAAFLLLTGLLGFALTAAAGAPGRWLTVSRLRTLGLTPRQGRLIAAGELLPVATVAAVGGPLLGALVAAMTTGPLGLRVLTGQVTDPATVLPWAVLAAVVALFLSAVPLLVRVEAALRRRLRLAEVLRVGGPT
ncbi:FtsX-like permease family protein [Actinoplanes xinjiangensis]|uniref:Putative ABC transport system permease protein n=1 Tax=Actinoplanes xinjiangensis TaxID=512350 RepID=A0A316F808_9ACTN|nr:permease [Actinoplanes xinjiangensis]PWK43323.1 putative ABC transport system permease protein [Actinoplanes xinjiangensis]GIF41637.1 membrane protein [Actinoplanes xinjiangensis]